MIEESKLNALLSLLDDPDKEVSDQVMSELLSYGQAIIPNLESAWEQAFDTTLQKEIEYIIQRINNEVLLDELRDWKEHNSDDLLEGILIVCKYPFPDLDMKRIRLKIEELKRSIWLEISHNFTPLEQVNIFNHVFYSLYRFKGNSMNLYDPMNYMINTLLDTKKGNPTSLGVLYLIIAQKLELNVYGVNLPQHFILAHTKYPMGDMPIQMDPRDNVIFYINTYNRGMIFTKNEIDLFLKKMKVKPKLSYYVPCSNIDVLKIYVSGLIFAYTKVGSKDKIEDLGLFMNILEE